MRIYCFLGIFLHLQSLHSIMLKVKHLDKVFEIDPDKNEAFVGTINKTPYKLSLDSKKKESFVVRSSNKTYEIVVLKADYETKEFLLDINGTKYPITLQDDFDILLQQLGMDKAVGKKLSELKAPMPGLVLQVVASVGQEIKKGETLLILEAMKMENVLKAPIDVKVKKVNVNKGQAVEKGETLIQFE